MHVHVAVHTCACGCTCMHKVMKGELGTLKKKCGEGQGNQLEFTDNEAMVTLSSAIHNLRSSALTALRTYRIPLAVIKRKRLFFFLVCALLNAAAIGGELCCCCCCWSVSSSSSSRTVRSFRGIPPWGFWL